MGGCSGVYLTSKMSTDWTLMSTLKNNCFHLREGQLPHICKQFGVDICICYTAVGQKLKPCAFIFFLCKFAAGLGWSASEAKK